MPTLPLHDCMIGGRVGRRRVQRLRWSIERAGDTIRRSQRAFCKLLSVRQVPTEIRGTYAVTQGQWDRKVPEFRCDSVTLLSGQFVT
jgi:hypothetical protein